jgi:hypothetical protein
MIEKGLARNVLTNVFPEECRAVGPNSLNDLLSQDVTIVAPDEGRPFPIMEIFEFLKEAAQFILAAIRYTKFSRISSVGNQRCPNLSRQSQKTRNAGPYRMSRSRQFSRKLKSLISTSAPKCQGTCGGSQSYRSEDIPSPYSSWQFSRSITSLGRTQSHYLRALTC